MNNEQIKILIAEDESIIALDIKVTLEKLGYTVSGVVYNADEVLENVNEKKPDLILMDIQLNGKKSGIELANIIRIDYEIPIIYLTALTDSDTLERAKQTEPSGYIVKPFNEKSLLSAIEMALYKYSIESELKKKSMELEQEKKKNDQLLRSILPSAVISELKDRGIVSPRLYKSTTILFSDFEACSDSNEIIPAEILIDELNELFARMDLIVRSYGLEKLKSYGDMYMICGGLPVETNDHAEKIIHAAIEMKNFLEERNQFSRYKWRMKAGINTGQVVAGTIGINKPTYDVWGDAVNVASRLEKLSEPGKINISQTTYALIKDVFDCEYRGKLVVKGKGKIDMFFVRGVKEHFMN